MSKDESGRVWSRLSLSARILREDWRGRRRCEDLVDREFAA